MKKYRKKPVVIEAIEWDGRHAEELLDFLENKGIFRVDGSLGIPTLEGVMEASVGDYIIKGVQGEFYPCKPDIFEQTYEEVE